MSTTAMPRWGIDVPAQNTSTFADSEHGIPATNGVVETGGVESRVEFDGQDIYDSALNTVQTPARADMVFQKSSPVPKSIGGKIAHGTRSHGAGVSKGGVGEIVLTGGGHDEPDNASREPDRRVEGKVDGAVEMLTNPTDNRPSWARLRYGTFRIITDGGKPWKHRTSSRPMTKNWKT